MNTPRPAHNVIAAVKLWTCNRCDRHEYPFAFSADRAPYSCKTQGCLPSELLGGVRRHTFRQTGMTLPMGATLTAPDAPWSNPDVPVPAIGQTLYADGCKGALHVVGYCVTDGALEALCWSDDQQTIMFVAGSDLPRRPAEPRTYSRDEQRAMTEDEFKAAEQAAQTLANAAHLWLRCCPKDSVSITGWQDAVRQFYAESRRRQTNKTRAKNAERNAKHAIESGTFTVGEKVEVHAFGRWYPGEVIALGRSRVTVRYTTRTTGNTFEKTVNGSKVRKAAVAA